MQADAFVLDLSLIFFHSVAAGFPILCSQLYFGEFKFFHDSVYENCPCLFYMYMLTNTTLNRLGIENSYILIAFVD